MTHKRILELKQLVSIWLICLIWSWVWFSKFLHKKMHHIQKSHLGSGSSKFNHAFKIFLTIWVPAPTPLLNLYHDVHLNSKVSQGRITNDYQDMQPRGWRRYKMGSLAVNPWNDVILWRVKLSGRNVFQVEGRTCAQLEQQSYLWSFSQKSTCHLISHSLLVLKQIKNTEPKNLDYQ